MCTSSGEGPVNPPSQGEGHDIEYNDDGAGWYAHGECEGYDDEAPAGIANHEAPAGMADHEAPAGTADHEAPDASSWQLDIVINFTL